MGTRAAQFIALLGLFVLPYPVHAADTNPLYDSGVYRGNSQALWHAYMAGKSDKEDSKMHKYMMMMQMMQANATAMAGANSRKNEKKEEAKASPTPTPSAELQIAKLEIPKQAEEKPIVDLSRLGKQIPRSPLPAPPIPDVSPNAALQIVASFAPAEKPATPPAREVATAPGEPPPKAEATKLPPSIPTGPAEDRIGYDSNLGERNVVPLPPAGNIVAGPAGNVSIPVVAGGGNITEPPESASTRQPFSEPPDTEGSSGGGGDGSSRGSRGDGFGDMIGDLLAMKVPTAEAEEEIVMPGKQENPGSNIFEYASYRYRHTETGKKKLKKKT